MSDRGRPHQSPTVEEADRRASAAAAGHAGDEAGARRLLGDPSPGVRATALASLARSGHVRATDVTGALVDPDPLVRRRACTVAAGVGGVDLVPLLDDPDPLVVDAAAWALGEQGPAAASGAVAALAAVAAGHADALCRESAVAALGAIGDPAGRDTVLAATSDKPAVRRRAVLALAAFDGPEVEVALRRALGDRDWQVRQAAEDLLEGGTE